MGAVHLGLVVKGLEGSWRNIGEGAVAPGGFEQLVLARPFGLLKMLEVWSKIGFAGQRRT
jgi:hypothetical protein